MNRFNPGASCRKCGSVKREIEWKKAPAVRADGVDYLLVTCSTCRHSENVLPLDAGVDDQAMNMTRSRARGYDGPLNSSGWQVP